MEAEKVRIDKWLWAARFFKTRSIAVDNINKDRVQINGQNIKPAREAVSYTHLTLPTTPYV
mgnify:CR=1 FL=1